MQNKKWNLLLVFTFLFIIVSIFTFGAYYKTQKADNYKQRVYKELASSVTSNIKTLINEKRNATLIIALSQAQNTAILDALLNKTDMKTFLKDISLQLRKETDFKNVWFHVIDKDGISMARSWTDKSGDDVSLIREDIRAMKKRHVIKTGISVGRFDMSFKAMVPLYSKSGKYIGIFETISHFNSIAKKLEENHFSPIIVVDKKYKEQIIQPFSNLFIGDNYVANQDADKNYLELIRKNSIEKFTSPSQNYVVDMASGNLVINYTLFDSNNLPMANFLLFKPLDEIDTTFLQTINSTANLFMFIASVVTIFIFIFLFSKKLDLDIQKDEKPKHLIAFSLLFVVLSLLYYLILYWSFENSHKRYIQNYNQNIKMNYSIINEKFNAIAHTMYDTIINTPEVLELVKKSYLGEKEKDEAREELYELLIEEYEILKQFNLKQFHFHLKNNESFLRFHRPKKYGDDLTGIRATVEWVNKNNQMIEGFEEGRMYNGFRNVFPLTYQDYKNQKKIHIGSVESSFSAFAIINEFIKNYDAKAGFLIDSRVVKTKVFNDEQSNYTKSFLQGFYFEKTIEKQLNHTLKHIDVNNFNSKDIKLVSKKIFKGAIFTKVSKDKNRLNTFIPIKNPVSKKVVAVIVLQIDNSIYKDEKESFLLMLVFGILSLMIAVLFAYREFSSKNKLKEFSIKTRQILDTQDSIIITTDSERILDVNKKFLTFFGYESLDQFREDYNCISNRFLQEKNYYHRLSDDENWLYSLKSLPKSERIVLMQDAHTVKHSFAVSYSDFGTSDYIITFTDISHSVKEQLLLKKKVQHDQLTGAYNREFFDANIDILIKNSKKSSNSLGLTLFDIDHFKEVNDVYGHNVGDVILKDLTKCVESAIRKDDYLIRWGGEEFIVVFETKSIIEAKRMAEHIRGKIAYHVFEEVKNLTCSFGVIVIDEDEDILKNIERADKALYKAKETGRNKVLAG